MEEVTLRMDDNDDCNWLPFSFSVVSLFPHSSYSPPAQHRMKSNRFSQLNNPWPLMMVITCLNRNRRRHQELLSNIAARNIYWKTVLSGVNIIIIIVFQFPTNPQKDQQLQPAGARGFPAVVEYSLGQTSALAPPPPSHSHSNSNYVPTTVHSLE